MEDRGNSTPNARPEVGSLTVSPWAVAIVANLKDFCDAQRRMSAAKSNSFVNSCAPETTSYIVAPAIWFPSLIVTVTIDIPPNDHTNELDHFGHSACPDIPGYNDSRETTNRGYRFPGRAYRSCDISCVPRPRTATGFPVFFTILNHPLLARPTMKENGVFDLDMVL